MEQAREGAAAAIAWQLPAGTEEGAVLAGMSSAGSRIWGGQGDCRLFEEEEGVREERKGAARLGRRRRR